MVGHQAIGPHLNPRLACLLGQQIAINILITVLKEDRLTPITSRGDVVRDARDNDAGDTGPPPALARPEQKGNIAPAPYFNPKW